MRSKIVVLVALAALVLIAFLWFSREPQSSSVATAAGADTEATRAAPNTADSLALAESGVERARSTAPAQASVVAPDVATEPKDDGPESIVTGRVVDDAGTPLAGANVQLISVDSWATGRKVPTVTSDGSSFEGFELVTGTGGKFRFETPTPTSDWISLRVEADAYHGLAGSDFGIAGGRNQPPIHDGENALGDFVLATTGAVRGVVESADGASIARAHLVVEGCYAAGFGIDASSDAQGSFALGHVPAGVYTIVGEAEGWMESRAPGVDVKRRATTTGVVIRFERAPTLTGRVIDERGAPLAEVDVSGWPQRGGPGAGTQSKSDGSFTMFLSQHDSYVLEIQSGEFEPWGGGESDKVFPPGTSGIQIVLRRAPHTTFVVIDDASGAPIEHYGIGVVDKPDENGWSSSSNSDPRPIEPHPHGECTIGADPARHRVQCEAPGFAPMVVDVAHDPGGAARQTLRMHAGGAIVGRVTFAGQPVARPNVELERCGTKVESPTVEDETDAEPASDEHERFDLDEYLGRVRMRAGTPDGSFRIVDLAPGMYKVTVHGGDGAARCVRDISVAAGAASDVGEIVLDAAARIQGRVVLGAGFSPVGLELSLDEWRTRARVDDAGGRFVFRGVVAGKHTVTLEQSLPTVLDQESVEVAVVSGGVADVVFDLSTRAPCPLSVRVMRARVPVAGIGVEWTLSKDGLPDRGGELGKTDEHGIATGHVEGGSAIAFRVREPGGFPVGSTPPTQLVGGIPYETTIAIDSGELVIVFPSTFEIPDAGYFQVSLERRGDGASRVESVQRFTAGLPFGDGQGPWTGLRCDLGPIATGEYDGSFRAMHAEHDDFTELGSPMNVHVSIHAHETTVVDVKIE